MRARFKLLIGQHTCVDPNVVDAGKIKIKLEDGTERDETRGELMERATRTYFAGDIVESDEDLVRVTSGYMEKGVDRRTGRSILDVDPSLQPKFERVVEGTSVHDGLLHQRAGETAADFLKRVQAAAATEGPHQNNPSQPAVGTPEFAAQAAANVQAGAKAGFNTSDTYDGMTLEELRKVAEEEEIPLGGAKTKDAIIKILRAAEVGVG